MHSPTHSGLSTPTSRDAGTPARRATEPLREICAVALLAGNAIFLLIGVSRLFVVIDDWASGFGLRSSVSFGQFVGLVALGLPMAALLIATHVSPMVTRSRLIVIAVLVEYGASAFFG